MPEDGTSVGIWIGQNEYDLLDDIDEAVDWRDSSRSEWFKDAARMYLAVEDVLQSHEVYFPNEREKRATVRSALNEYLSE